MNIDLEINNYLLRLSEKEKSLLLGIIKKFYSIEKKELMVNALIAYNQELEEAVAKIKGGDFVEHSHVLKEANEW